VNQAFPDGNPLVRGEAGLKLSPGIAMLDCKPRPHTQRFHCAVADLPPFM
jgi:hypothetical protein